MTTWYEYAAILAVVFAAGWPLSWIYRCLEEDQEANMHLHALWWRIWRDDDAA